MCTVCFTKFSLRRGCNNTIRQRILTTVSLGRTNCCLLLSVPERELDHSFTPAACYHDSARVAQDLSAGGKRNLLHPCLLPLGTLLNTCTVTMNVTMNEQASPVATVIHSPTVTQRLLPHRNRRQQLRKRCEQPADDTSSSAAP